jgi:hypothetical protein
MMLDAVLCNHGYLLEVYTQTLRKCDAIKVAMRVRTMLWREKVLSIDPLQRLVLAKQNGFWVQIRSLVDDRE